MVFRYLQQVRLQTNCHLNTEHYLISSLFYLLKSFLWFGLPSFIEILPQWKNFFQLSLLFLKATKEEIKKSSLIFHFLFSSHSVHSLLLETDSRTRRAKVLLEETTRRLKEKKKTVDAILLPICGRSVRFCIIRERTTQRKEREYSFVFLCWMILLTSYIPDCEGFFLSLCVFSGQILGTDGDLGWEWYFCKDDKPFTDITQLKSIQTGDRNILRPNPWRKKKEEKYMRFYF